MIYGGNATVYVSNMDQAIRFYTEVLGLKLTNRFGNHFATVQAGRTLVIALHPVWREQHPRPGTKGAVQIGLSLAQDVPIAAFAARLRKHGVEVNEIANTESGNYLMFEDPDGNSIYLGDWDPDFDAPAGESLDARLARQEAEAATSNTQSAARR